MSISFHVNFPLDCSLLSRALHAYATSSPSSLSQEMSAFGVGNRKVPAYKGWLKHTGLWIPKSGVTPFGQLVLDRDPSIGDLGTRWIIHYHLSRRGGSEDAELWHWLINSFLPIYDEFDEAQLLQAANQSNIKCDNLKILQSYLRILLKSYIQPMAFGPLGILERLDEGQYRIGIQRSVHHLLVGYLIFQEREDKYPGTTTISVSDLLRADGNAGKTFLMNRTNLEENLRALRSDGYIGIMQFADHDHAQFLFSGSPLALLKQYYDNSQE